LRKLCACEPRTKTETDVIKLKTADDLAGALRALLHLAQERRAATF
jgi:hypothetical protein